MKGRGTRNNRPSTNYELEVKELSNESFEVPRDVKLFSCIAEGNDSPFTITQGFDTFEYTNSYTTPVDIKSSGNNVLTIATTTTLKMILLR